MSPLNHLAAAGKMYPEAWKQVERFRADRARYLDGWPQWCFLPMSLWYVIVSEGGIMPLNRVPDIGRLAAIGSWRYSQGIYRFDESVYAALRDTVPSGEMPVEVLFRLPEWSIYIETPGVEWSDIPLHGFWAHLEFDTNEKTPELRLLLDTEQSLIPVALHMGRWTITEAVDRATQQAVKQGSLIGVPESLISAVTDCSAATVSSLVSLVLYLCSDEPEIDDEREPGSSPQRPAPKRTKGGWRLFPAKRPRVWSVGAELGKQLRQAAEPGEVTGKTKSPHLRRAHWHGYWTGPRGGERKFGYKWLPPVAVGLNRED